MASKAQLTGMRGVYLVAAELTRLGFIASPTSRGADGADLLVTDQHCRRAYSVQVKTNAASFSYFNVGGEAISLCSESHIYVLVNLKRQATEFYVVPSIELAKRIKSFQRKNSTWHAVACKEVARHKDAWAAFGNPASLSPTRSVKAASRATL